MRGRREDFAYYILGSDETVFNAGSSPAVASTKSQTGHGFPLVGAMEAAFYCPAVREGVLPASLNLTEPGPGADGLHLVATPTVVAPETALSNSSGFGGANVVLVLRRVAP